LYKLSIWGIIQVFFELVVLVQGNV
jgi:hypothetical protein